MHSQEHLFHGGGWFTRSSGGRSEGRCTRSTSAWRPGKKDARLGRFWTQGRAQHGTSIQQSLIPKKQTRGPFPIVRAQLRTPGRAGSPHYWYPCSQEGPRTQDIQKAFFRPLTSARALCDWKNTASLWPHLRGQLAAQLPNPPLFLLPFLLGEDALTFGTGGPRFAATWGPGTRQR